MLITTCFTYPCLNLVSKNLLPLVYKGYQNYLNPSFLLIEDKGGTLMFILDSALAQVPFWFQTPSVTPKSDVEKVVERAEKEFTQSLKPNNKPYQKSPVELEVEKLEKQVHDQFTNQPRSTTQLSDAYPKTELEKEVERLEQQVFEQFRQVPGTRSQTTGPADILGLQPSGHNTFTRPGFSGKWIKQLDRTIFYEGGEHLQTKTKVNPGTYLNGQPLANRITPLLGTHEIAELNLTRNQDGTFSNSEINGRFLLQWDGSMYFTGGLDKNGQAMAPYTYKSGSGADTTKFNPLPSSVVIAQSNLIPNPDGVTFSKPGLPGRFIPQVDGSVFYEGGNTIQNGAPVPYKPQTFIPGQGVDKSKTEGDDITKFILKNNVERDKNGNLNYTDSTAGKKWTIRIEGNELLWTGRLRNGAIATFKFIGFDNNGNEKWQRR